jgi:PEP-CTERM motif
MSSTTILVSLLSTLVLGTPSARAGVIFVDPGDARATPGHPARAWTEAEKAIVNEALSEWKTFIENFDQVLGTWTLRWEDADLFKNWEPSGGQNLKDANGLTVRRGGWAAGKYPSPPKDSPDFPEGEIYFNTLTPDGWFFDPTPATDDPGEPPAGKFDFLTIAKHEVGHALGIVGDLPNGTGAVMEGQIGLAERHRVGPEDIQFYRQQVPEPSTVLLTASGVLTLGGLAWRRRARSARG